MTEIAITLATLVVGLTAVRHVRHAYRMTLGAVEICDGDDNCGCSDCVPDDGLADFDDSMFVARAVVNQIQVRLDTFEALRERDPLLEDCRDIIERLMWTPSTSTQRRSCQRRAFWCALIGIDRDGHYWTQAPHLISTAWQCQRCHVVTWDTIDD